MDSSAYLQPIQFLWVRGELSRMEILSLRSFRVHGHPVHLYSYEPPPNVPAGVELMDAREILDESLVPAKDKVPFGRGGYSTFANLFRYKLLYEKGGWWADTDVVAVRPWSDFPDVVVSGTRETKHGIRANIFVLRFPPGHPQAKELLDAFPKKPLSEIEFGKTGPILAHEVLGADGVKRYCQAPEVFAPVAWNAAWQLLRTRRERFSFGELGQRIRRPHLSVRFTEKTVAVHLWNEMWKDAGYDKSAKYDASCLYEKLQARYNPEG